MEALLPSDESESDDARCGASESKSSLPLLALWLLDLGGRVPSSASRCLPTRRPDGPLRLLLLLLLSAMPAHVAVR